MPEAEKITIGECSFDIRRPKLGQLRRIIDALDAMGGKEGGALIDATVELIVAGISRPDVTADSLLEIETTIVEINNAVAVILRAAGLRATDAEPGEAAPQLAAN